ncbi:MAG: hypothetical protein GF341_07240 [candidate division Zixibacteria bacterium]|nr:hypothetical protein [candidate division Zixibacteria bacterium]
MKVPNVKMPNVNIPGIKWNSKDDTMNMIKWIVGIVLFASLVALVIVFWPTIMQTGQRYLGRSGVREADELEDIPRAA